MLGSTFYHQTIRKYVAVFGTLFNDINIERKNSSGTVVERLKVPLAYGPKQKWLLAVQDTTADRKVIATRTPRMGFAMTGVSYDPARKLNTIGRNVAANTSSTTTNMITMYNPVPYNFDFELFILVKNAEDGTTNTPNSSTEGKPFFESGASYATTSFDDKVISTDAYANNVGIETVADGILDFSEGNPFSEGTGY